MASATIPLAKGYDPSKLEFPVFVSVKHDGVPIRIDIAPHKANGFTYATQSRQAKQVLSVSRLVKEFITRLYEKGVELDSFPRTFVAEVTHKTLKDFKDISGTVRREYPQDGLILNFFDFVMHTDERRHDPFFIRQSHLRQTLTGIEDENMQCVPQQMCGSEADVQTFIAGNTAPDQEGWIIRSMPAQWAPGKRQWGYQKHVMDPTVDLKIVGFEEARNAAGIPLGMVGRVLAEYIEPSGNVTTIGIGPGKLTHAERIELWEEWTRGAGGGYSGGFAVGDPARIACIKYKRDPSYTALRQPTFQHWRPEKTEPSYE